MQFRVLGPLQVVRAGQPIELGGYRQRLVLALLISRVNTTVTTDWLVDALWGESAPRTARRTLQVYLTRLRRRLEPDTISSFPGGYTLSSAADDVDALRFETLARRGETLVESRPQDAAATLRRALALWRGSPYGDLGDAPSLRLEARRLAELRLAVTERRIEADLRNGDDVGLVGELDELVVEHPLRENLRGLQMLALYRAGRQADALEAFEDARRTLAHEVGIDPSANLRRLQAQILHQDPSHLVLGASTTDAPPGPERATSRAGRVSTGTLPSGLVTFVITDIEGSTRLFRRFPDGYPGMLSRHHEILANAFERHGGMLVETDGDGTLCVFPDASGALRACVIAQQALEREPWAHGVVLRVRMGVHSGLAAPRGGDYVSLSVHQAARVAEAAHGGQILVSAATAALAKDLDDVVITPLGRYRLRGFDEPEALSMVAVPGGRADSPAVRALPAEGHNLTRPATRFIDRDQELRRLESTLAPGRLVSIVGPGGVGKTRLAAEVGINLVDRWPGGVWRIGVDSLDDASRLTEAVAEAISATKAAEADEQELFTAVRDAGVLLILDGCERHRSGAAALAAQLLERNSRSGLLTTSREPLRVSGEIVHRLRPLSLTPTSGSPSNLAPAMELYIDRAQAANPSFTLDETNAEAVETLVRHLDGLPLAEEIAAARAALASPAELLRSIEKNVNVLATDDPSLPHRQRTIENLLRWSEDLLSASERVALRRLSVFAGSFTLASAEEAAADADVTAAAVPELVWSLVDQSLLLADPSAGETRYRMLALVRRYAERRLADSGEQAGTALRVARMMDRHIGPDRPSDHAWVSAVSAELGNLRHVVAWLLHAGGTEAVDLASRLAMTVLRFHDGVQSYRAGISEATSWLEVLPSTSARGPLLAGVAWLHLRRQELVEAGQLARQAHQVVAELGTPSWDDLGVERTLGEIAIRSGRPHDALRLSDEGLRRAPNLRARARMYSMAGIAYVELGDLDAAARSFDQELAVCRELGDDFLTTRAEGNAAENALARGDLVEAAKHQMACLELATAYGQPVFVAYSAIVAARLASPDDPATSVRLLTKATAVLADTQHRLYAEDEALIHSRLGKYRDMLGAADYRRAQEAGLTMGLDELAAEASHRLERVLLPDTSN